MQVLRHADAPCSGGNAPLTTWSCIAVYDTVKILHAMPSGTGMMHTGDVYNGAYHCTVQAAVANTCQTVKHAWLPAGVPGLGFLASMAHVAVQAAAWAVCICRQPMPSTCNIALMMQRFAST